jgi:hypothetical protein
LSQAMGSNKVSITTYLERIHMEANKDKTTEGTETSTTQSDGLPAPATSPDTEFKIEVRKLEVPVRPRGVLAE